MPTIEELERQEADALRDLLAVAQKHIPALDEADSHWSDSFRTFRRVARRALNRSERRLEAVR